MSINLVDKNFYYFNFIEVFVLGEKKIEKVFF